MPPMPVWVGVQYYNVKAIMVIDYRVAGADGDWCQHDVLYTATQVWLGMCS